MVSTTKAPDGCGFLGKCNRICNTIFLSRYFYLSLFSFACLIVAFGTDFSQKNPALVANSTLYVGAVVFVGIICLALILCDDILATTMPFLLLCVFVTVCYDSFDEFIKFAWIAVPAVFSLFFHFIVYRRKFQIGKTFFPLLAVSVALVLGGVGYTSAAEYFRPVTLYYTFFLGFGMVGAYLLLKPALCAKRNYDAREKLLSLLYIMGMLAAFLVFCAVFTNYNSNKVFMLKEFQPANNLSTLLMLAMPCPFFFAHRNLFHLTAPVVMLVAMILSGSRGGMLLGAVEFLVCLIVTACWDKPHRFLYSCLTMMYVGIIVVCGESVLVLNSWDKQEARVKLLYRLKEIFPSCPIFGHGLGYTGNTDIYSPVKGAMEWYHMMIPQIVGSLGTVGVLAYGYQLVMRALSVFAPLRRADMRERGLILTLGLSYFGVLLMSQVNPGLFSPIPYSLLAVMIFALLDGDSALPRRRKKATVEPEWEMLIQQ